MRWPQVWQPPPRFIFADSKLALNQYDGWPQYDADQTQGKKQIRQIQEQRITL